LPSNKNHEHQKSFLAMIALSLNSSFAIAEPASESGIALDSNRKVAVYELAKENLVYSAWGVEHYERNYLLGLDLAKAESLKIDEDVLFAAAFLHDIGVVEPYVITDAEHSQTATENIELVLNSTDFPAKKIPDAKAAILAHMFYAEVPDNNTAIILHDADTLDFLGIVGVTSIHSLSTLHPWATDLPTAFATLENFSEQLPASIKNQAAIAIGKARALGMKNFLETLKSQSIQGTGYNNKS
jgi:uncharacterized protein